MECIHKNIESLCCTPETNITLYVNYTLIERKSRASLVVQWLRISLLMQGTWVQALVWEDPSYRAATKPVHHSY